MFCDFTYKIQLVFNYLLNDILQNNCKKFERLYS